MSAVTQVDPARVLHCAARAGSDTAEVTLSSWLHRAPLGFTGLQAPGTGAEAVNLQIS